MRHTALLALALAVAPARAQFETAELHARATLHARAEGRDVQVALQFAVERGWHIYHGPERDDLGPDGVVGKPTAIELRGIEAQWGDWRFPEPDTEEQDFGTPLLINVHRGTLTVWRRGVLAEGASVDGLSAVISGQACEDGPAGVCVPYEETVRLSGAGAPETWRSFPADLGAQPGAPGAGADARAPPPAASGGAAAEDLDPGSDGSLLAFLLSAVFWGLFTLLMPCTYPMIPITISYFTKQATARHTGTLPLSLAYGAGIVLIFVLIGVAVGPVIIAFATHPVTNLVIAALFLLFALVLFGVLTLQPPAFLLNAAGAASQKGGFLGVFLMGATLVVTSFTCTAPFVGTLLSTGAAQGGLGRLALGMGVFGATIALPFVWLSMVPAKVKSMPRAGEWMHVLKVWLGFVEVAAALKFLSNADLVWGWGWLSRELFLVLWAAIFLAAAAYLFGWIRLVDDSGERAIGPRRLVGGLATLMLAAYCSLGALGHSLDPVMTAIVPNYSSRLDAPAGAAAARGHVIIKDDYGAALARARSEKKQLLVNFTGFT